jgi:hypothetical protein
VTVYTIEHEWITIAGIPATVELSEDNDGRRYLGILHFKTSPAYRPLGWGPYPNARTGGVSILSVYDIDRYDWIDVCESCEQAAKEVMDEINNRA